MTAEAKTLNNIGASDSKGPTPRFGLGIPEAVLIGLMTIIAFVLAVSYQRGYVQYYGVPSEFAQISTDRAIYILASAVGASSIIVLFAFILSDAVRDTRLGKRRAAMTVLIIWGSGLFLILTTKVHGFSWISALASFLLVSVIVLTAGPIYAAIRSWPRGRRIPPDLFSTIGGIAIGSVGLLTIVANNLGSASAAKYRSVAVFESSEDRCEYAVVQYNDATVLAVAVIDHKLVKGKFRLIQIDQLREEFTTVRCQELQIIPQTRGASETGEPDDAPH